MGKISVGIIGLGSVASNLIESLVYYKKSHSDKGIIIDQIFGYRVEDIEIKCAFDVASDKIGKDIADAIYSTQNIFERNPSISRDDVKQLQKGKVFGGNLKDGIDDNYRKKLREFGAEVLSNSNSLSDVFQENQIDVLLNLTPVGAVEDSLHYAEEALKGGIAFINCNPTSILRNDKIRQEFIENRIPLLGDDIKSQLGTTLIHRSLLSTIRSRGSEIDRTSQINMGGNMDFFNLDNRSATKIESKKFALSQFVRREKVFVKNAYNSNYGSLKRAYIDVNARVFGNSPLDIRIFFESDDKANASGCIADLVRFAKGFSDGEIRVSEENLNTVSSFYMKSPVKQQDEVETLDRLRSISCQRQ